jgi:hypothetical protein
MTAKAYQDLVIPLMQQKLNNVEVEGFQLENNEN